MPIVDFPEKKPPVVALWGLANRKNRWSLSWKGWLCLLLLSLGVFGIFLRTIHPFLAVTDRIDTDTMVVEGWIGQTDLVQVVDEYRRGHYQRVYTTGGPVHGVTEYQNDYSTSAHIAAQTLIDSDCRARSSKAFPRTSATATGHFARPPRYGTGFGRMIRSFQALSS